MPCRAGLEFCGRTGKEIYYYDENNQHFLSVERNATDDTVRTRFWIGNTEIWCGDGNGIKEKTMSLSLSATAVST